MKMPFGTGTYVIPKFSTDHIDLADVSFEMNQPTVVSDKTSTAQYCAETYILEHLILRTRFEYLY